MTTQAAISNPGHWPLRVFAQGRTNHPETEWGEPVLQITLAPGESFGAYVYTGLRLIIEEAPAEEKAVTA